LLRIAFVLIDFLPSSGSFMYTVQINY